ncbi:hypothetical protein V1477_006893 [Vespula maculifrons]|uniref:Uncharacterized protein n=3 Tax=Vespula TaxID=7451 RepID=A0A834NZ84_VESPE|nr:hypothetical protein HZH66_008164 [Vespula vulgaris]KAF7421954.1 hypothetical protein H0235_009790 [Vespula pensylvanica]
MNGAKNDEKFPNIIQTPREIWIVGNISYLRYVPTKTKAEFGSRQLRKTKLGLPAIDSYIPCTRIPSSQLTWAQFDRSLFP